MLRVGAQLFAAAWKTLGVGRDLSEEWLRKWAFSSPLLLITSSVLQEVDQGTSWNDSRSQKDRFSICSSKKKQKFCSLCHIDSSWSSFCTAVSRKQQALLIVFSVDIWSGRCSACCRYTLLSRLAPAGEPEDDRFAPGQTWNGCRLKQKQRRSSCLEINI